jgi:uncharacterized protein YndB with AHSA1/START domain
MTVISTSKDVASLTLTLTLIAEFEASPEQVWNVWEDPRKLEQWWGPPMFPATFTRHDFIVGGESRYFMTGPGGETSKGWWRFESIDPTRRIDFVNGLAGDDGEPTPGVEPMAGSALFEATGQRTRMTVVTRFIDQAQMETMLEMGMEEGMAGAIGQIDGIL